MAGHSEWANRKYRKRRQDRKKAKVFGKLSRRIISAARRGGGDPEKNTELRNIIERAKDANMPKENIERAVLKGIGELPGVEYEDHVYEGYGPGGIAVMVEVTTDNKNRSISQIRRIFEDHGGKVGQRGCVSYQFDRRGILVVSAENCDETDLFDRAVEAGARDVRLDGDTMEVITGVDQFTEVKGALQEAGVALKRAEVTQLPRTTVPVGEEEGRRVLELLETLDEHDDVQEVYSNFDINDETFETIEAGAAG